MTDQERKWRFYGRREEIRELRAGADCQRYQMLAVLGGRGVGKTTLIEEALKSLKRQPPVVWTTLPPVRKEDGVIERLHLSRGCCLELADKAHEAGLESEIHTAAGQPAQGAGTGYLYGRTLGNLLRAGAVVVIDEFHNVEPLLLSGAVVAALESVRRDQSVTGKLIVAGSHQQQMHALLHDSAGPFHGRPTGEIQLLPLAAPDLLEMAAEQGWLDKPRRLLAAYAVFGGVPLCWERLQREHEAGVLPEPDDGSEESWRRMFLAREVRRLRAAPAQRFDHRALVELSPDALALAKMAADSPRARGWSEIVEKFRALPSGPQAVTPRGRAAAALHMLERHLLIAEMTSGGDKVRITDHRALFELTVESGWPKGKPKKGAAQLAGALARAAENEGRALERLAEEWLLALGGHTWVERNLEAKGKTGKVEVEIDVAAGGGGGAADEEFQVMASCKRARGKHDLEATRKSFERFLELNGGSAAGGRPERIRRLLISPETPAAMAGFETWGLPDMAQELGFEVRPWPAAPAADERRGEAPALRRKREDGPEPSF